MIAYKLCRKLKDGNIASLFINNNTPIKFGVWLQAKSYPTPNFKKRKGYHCTATKKAPHLSKKGRVWVKVEILDYEILKRPKSQGSIWYLAQRIKFLSIEKNNGKKTKKASL